MKRGSGVASTGDNSPEGFDPSERRYRDKSVVTPSEAAVFIGRSRLQAHARNSDGTLPHFRINPRIMLMASEVRAWDGLADGCVNQVARSNALNLIPSRLIRVSGAEGAGNRRGRYTTT